MGAGDWLMATGQVKTMYARCPMPVLVLGADGRTQWSDMFTDNPKILRVPRGRFQTLRNGPNARPYIAEKTTKRWIWKPFAPEPGELFFSDEERAFAEPYRGRIMIEPNVKANGHANKAWRFKRWEGVASQFDGVIQCGAEGSPWMKGVENVITPTFRHAAAVLSVCRAFAGCEGGLMHAAAAVGVPGVILFSEFIDPSITGYAMHTNVRHAGAPCGSRIPCVGCVRSMEAISIDEVTTYLAGVLQ